MAVHYFPEALNQGHAALSEVLRGEALILFFCAFVGFLGYALTIVVLGFFTAFVRHLLFRVMHKASMIMGIAFAALIQLYRIPFLLYRPSDLAAIVGISLAFLALAFGIGIAVRTVSHNAPSPATH